MANTYEMVHGIRSYVVTVQRQGRFLAGGELTIEAASPMLACEAAERQAALMCDGTLAYLSHYFAAKVRPAAR